MNENTPVAEGLVTNTPLIELDLLKTLVAISETGNFSAAAERVGRTPSAVSMQVKRLEEIVGQSVFDRGPRAVSLTVAGEKLLAHGRKLLAENRQIMAQFASPDMVGEVRLGMFDDVAERYMPGILRQFNDHWPGISILTRIENSKELAGQVMAGKLDVAIISATSSYFDNMPVEKLATEDIVWAGLKGGAAGRCRPLPVTSWEDCCVFDSKAAAALENHGIPYVKKVNSATTTGQKLAMMADFAVGPLARASLDERIVDVGTANGLPPIGSYVIGLIVADKPITRPMQTLIDHLRLVFG